MSCSQSDDIVISGISGRFPDSDSIDELRDNLFAHKDLITEDDRRWPPGLYGLPTRSGKIRDLSRFDAHFFGIHSKQAQHLDPQCRLLLETTFEAIVDSGYNPDTLRGKNIGVYIGLIFEDFSDAIASNADDITPYTAIGSKKNMFANRISHVFDFRGPSLVVDTACSSSLQALDSAYWAMRLGHIDMAVVGGANATLRPSTSVFFDKYNMLSKSGKCQFLDAQADGYVRSEAVSVILLQRRSDAKRIYGTVLNIRTNCDGYKSQGITYPSKDTQVVLMKTALAQCQLQPQDIHYIEAHGTGTQAGDLVEVSAIHEVYGQNREEPVLVGSVKTNIGHTESASGMAAIAKVVIALESHTIPANLHLRELNPKLSSFMGRSLKPVTTDTPLQDSIVAINSFGFGGSNAHLLIRPEPKPTHDNYLSTNGCLRLIPLWGRTETSVRHIIDFIDNNEDKVTDDFLALLSEVTNEQYLRAMNYRGFVVHNTSHDDCESHQDIVELSQDDREVWFLLSGMGVQWKGMASGLMDLKVFSESIQRIAKYLEPFDIDLIDLITNEENESIDTFSGSSIAISAVQIALIDLLNELNVKCDRMVGHSAGELLCAYADGLMDAKQTIEATYYRAKCLEEARLEPGLMAAVGLTWQQTVDRCPPDVYPACHNSQHSVTIAGLYSETKNFLNKLKEENIFTKEVKSCGLGFHCPLMNDIREDLINKLEPIIPKRRRSPKWMSSSVPVDQWSTIESQYSSAQYYVNNLLNPVLFDQCIQQIPKNAVVIEIAPDSLFRNVVRKAVGPDLAYVGLMKRNNCEHNLSHLLASIGQIHCLGLNPRVQNLYPRVEFPVRRGTQSTGALIKWDHSEQWLVTLYPKHFNNQPQSRSQCLPNGTHVKDEQNGHSTEADCRQSEEPNYINKINNILGIRNSAKVKRNAKLHELGLDSLMNIEVKDMLSEELNIEFAIEELPHFSYGELIDLKTNLNMAHSTI